jgi:ABC-type Fe3+ transport system substrate-binding protein
MSSQLSSDGGAHVSRHRPFRIAAVALAFLLASTACGSSPTAPGAAAPASTADASSALSELSAKLEGLDPAARRQELIRLAQEEGGTVSFYGSTNPEDVDPVIAAFEESTGITVDNYRASTSDVLRRIQEEAAAGHAGADVTIGGRAEYTQLQKSGLLANFTTPVSEQIHEGGVQEDGIDVYRVLRIVLWNTNRIPADQAPKTWEDVFEKYPGELILDPSDWDWFATFTKTYLMGEKGMTEQQAIDYWTRVAKSAVVISGHTLGTQLVTSGENAISAVNYQHGLPPEGAPVEWRPPIWPVIEDSTLISILKNTERPASALLLTEFFLTDAQPILYEGGRSPANTTAPSAWPAEYNDLTVPVDKNLFTDEGEANRWMALYEQVLMGAGQGAK